MRLGDTAGAIVDAFAFLSRVVAGDPDAVRELTEAQAAEDASPFDWAQGFSALGVLLFAIWACLPLHERWLDHRRARLLRLDPSLSLAEEEVAHADPAAAKTRGLLLIRGFLSINPGVFVLLLSALFEEAFLICLVAIPLILLLIIFLPGRRYASPERFRRHLEDVARQRAQLIGKGHLKETAPGVYAYTPAYHASQRSSSASSGRSSSSSSSGGGRSGGGGASSGW